MDTNIKAVVEECTTGSENGTLKFPQVVMKLMAAGVERYHADLRRAEKIYYMPSGESVVVAAEPVAGTPPLAFSAPGVEAAVRAVQAGKQNYREFCEAILAAGCVGYLVSMPGRRAVYYGATAEMHVEHFPPAP